jgi:thioredoxin-dependent peroxiredoxin
MVSVGKTAPAFSLDTDTGERLSLKDLKGRPVVLYFYPKDDTPGCTVEACEFRDAFPRFKGTKAVILGISPDSVASHVKFKTKFDLPFTLLADPDHEIAEKYGVWQKKSMYGRTYMGIARTTFVIDKNGKVAKVFAKVKPKGHAEEVEQAIDEL